jgi:2-amino-4-hydroxy-6-hydroxymethyldihydropteridine diphosphokinase
MPMPSSTIPKSAYPAIQDHDDFEALVKALSDAKPAISPGRFWRVHGGKGRLGQAIVRIAVTSGDYEVSISGRKEDLSEQDRLANIREGGPRACSLHESDFPIRVSSIYETAPVDCEPGTMPYLNAVMQNNFAEPPVALLDRLLEIQRAMGRTSKRPRNSPRIIDLAVLYAGNLALNNPEIIIPHPRLRQRRFALTPLTETSPDLVLSRSVDFRPEPSRRTGRSGPGHATRRSIIRS